MNFSTEEIFDIAKEALDTLKSRRKMTAHFRGLVSKLGITETEILSVHLERSYGDDALDLRSKMIKAVATRIRKLLVGIAVDAGMVTVGEALHVSLSFGITPRKVTGIGPTYHVVVKRHDDEQPGSFPLDFFSSVYLSLIKEHVIKKSQ